MDVTSQDAETCHIDIQKIPARQSICCVPELSEFNAEAMDGGDARRDKGIYGIVGL